MTGPTLTAPGACSARWLTSLPGGAGRPALVFLSSSRVRWGHRIPAMLLAPQRRTLPRLSHCLRGSRSSASARAQPISSSLPRVDPPVISSTCARMPNGTCAESARLKQLGRNLRAVAVARTLRPIWQPRPQARLKPLVLARKPLFAGIPVPTTTIAAD